MDNEIGKHFQNKFNDEEWKSLFAEIAESLERIAYALEQKL